MKTILLSLGLLVVIVLLAWALGEQASATRQIATAATVSAAGQTAGSVTATVLATLLAVVLLGAGGVVVYLLLRLKLVERRLSENAPRVGRWLPGPNARWEQGEQQGGALTGDPLAQLVQLEIMRHLRELRGPAPAYQAPQPALTEESDAEQPLWPW